MKKIIYLLLSCCMYSCLYADFQSGIKIYNNSEHNVYFYLGLGGTSGTLSPDTTFPSKYFTWNRVIPKKTQSDYTIPEKSWKDVYNINRQDTLCFFLIDTDTIGKYG